MRSNDMHVGAVGKYYFVFHSEIFWIWNMDGSAIVQYFIESTTWVLYAISVSLSEEWSFGNGMSAVKIHQTEAW